MHFKGVISANYNFLWKCSCEIANRRTSGWEHSTTPLPTWSASRRPLQADSPPLCAEGWDLEIFQFHASVKAQTHHWMGVATTELIWQMCFHVPFRVLNLFQESEKQPQASFFNCKIKVVILNFAVSNNLFLEHDVHCSQQNKMLRFSSGHCTVLKPADQKC